MVKKKNSKEKLSRLKKFSQTQNFSHYFPAYKSSYINSSFLRHKIFLIISGCINLSPKAEMNEIMHM